jgi:SAM-dependent methyltransferase
MSATLTTTVVSADSRHQSYFLKTPDEHKKLYDDWARTYNDDVLGSSTEYVGPVKTVEAVQAARGNLSGNILDAGCGTGLAGVALHQAGARQIDGIDVSPGMLRLAQDTGVYRDLVLADMLKPLSHADETYDVVTCVGTFTTGHVGPDPALPELVRVTKKGGVVVATIYDGIWKSEGFEAEVQRMKDAQLVDVLSTERTDYRKAEGEKGMARSKC